MYLSRIIFLLVFIVLSFVFPKGIQGQSNEGTQFWFGFMEHLDAGNNKVAMITSKVNTSGTIAIPGQGWSQAFSVSANEVTVINLPASAETKGSEAVENRGVLVTTQAPVTLYIHQYFGFRSEATAVFPKQSIGNSYYVMTYRGVVHQGEDHYSEFLLIGNEDETTIDIRVSDDTRGGRRAGDTFQIILNEGETYQVQASNGNGDLTGSFIDADKVLTVMGGASWTEVPNGCAARDNLLEQMYPISTWGDTYVSIPNANVSYDVFRLLAAEDGTNVLVEGTAINNTYQLDAGEFVEYTASEATFIRANKGIAVAQFMVGTGCNGHAYGDPSMVVLNSVVQTRDTVTLFNSSFEQIEENYINIITNGGDENDVSLDGQLLSARGITMTAIGNSGQFSFARVPVAAGAHTIIAESSCGVIATAYGYGPAESYAYSGGASFSPINSNPIPEGGCLNDTVYFATGLPEARFEVLWELGDGFTTRAHEFTHIFTNLGIYPSRLIVEDLCLGIVDTLYEDMLVTLRQDIAVDEAYFKICEGGSIDLGATDLAGADFEWTGPKDFFSEEQYISLNGLTSDQSGFYEVVGIVSGCATFPDTVEVDIVPTPMPDLGVDTLVCGREQTFLLAPGDFEEYLWQDGTRESQYEVFEEGIYWVRVEDDFGCVGTDTVQLIEQCPTKVFLPTVFSPNGDNINDSFGILGNDINRYKMSVYNRWGALMFYTEIVENTWDGTFKGEEAPEGVYVWVVEIEGFRSNGTSFTAQESGSVTLVR